MNPLSCLIHQHALRLMAFGQIYKVLEMEPLPSNKPSQKYPWSDKEGVCTRLPTCLLALLQPMSHTHILSVCSGFYSVFSVPFTLLLLIKLSWVQ